MNARECVEISKHRTQRAFAPRSIKRNARGERESCQVYQVCRESSNFHLVVPVSSENSHPRFASKNLTFVVTLPINVSLIRRVQSYTNRFLFCKRAYFCKEK